jgi:predicted PolB exonuclease-like 3'-5' exonuclease
MTPILAFDIETIPDIAGLRRTHDLPPGLSDDGVLDWYTQRRRAQTGGDFMPLHYQRIVAIACALRDGSGFKIASVGTADDAEPELIRRFFDLIDKHTPQLVSWNGGAFDLPVLSYRALIHGVTAAKFWDWGDDDREFRFNSYLSRFHTRHLDLMDVLAMYQPRNNAPLDDFARLAGLPGKIGVGGAQVWPAYLRGEMKAIRDYCEVDCVNTYLLYLRFQMLRGVLQKDQYDREQALLRSALEKQNAGHWREFLHLWEA